MSALGRSIARFFRSVTDAVRGSRVPKAGGRKIDSRVGPMARRFMSALDGILKETDWQELMDVGRMESKLRGLHEQLRPVSSSISRRSEIAEDTRREIDALLSEPNGTFALTLREFPANGSHRAIVSRLRDRFTMVHSAAIEVLEAHVIALSTNGRLKSILERFEPALPATCLSLGVAELEGRLLNATSQARVDAVSKMLEAYAALLEERFSVLNQERARLVEVLEGIQGLSPNIVHADLEKSVSELRLSVHEAASIAIADGVMKCDAAADQHISRMSVGDASDIFHSPVRNASKKSVRRKWAKISPQDEPRTRWSALHRFRVMRIEEQASLPFSSIRRAASEGPDGGAP